MKTTKELVKFDFDIAVISALDAKYKDIQITDGTSYAIVMAGLAEYRALRLKIDDIHKRLKADILEAGRGLDGDKNRLKALLEPGEDHLKEVRQVEDDRKAKIKEEKDRKERERIEVIQEKIGSIRNLGVVNNLSAAHIEERLVIVEAMTLGEKPYMEFVDQARETQKTAITVLQEALNSRLQFEKEDAKRKAEAERLEAQRKEQEAAQAKIDEGSRKVREGIAKLEADRIAAEKTKEREEFERQAKIKAEQEAKEKAEKEERNRIERAAAEAKEKGRQEALKPDKEKLNSWIEGFNGLGSLKPALKTKEAKEILRIAWESIQEVLQAAIWKTEKL